MTVSAYAMLIETKAMGQVRAREKFYYSVQKDRNDNFVLYHFAGTSVRDNWKADDSIDGLKFHFSHT